MTEHRDEEGELVTAEMIRLECVCTFWNFQPTEAFQAQCPNILVICHGDHPHPIPIPTKTPPSIRSKIMDLLGALHQDLPDLTPRRFMCHPCSPSILTKASSRDHKPNPFWFASITCQPWPSTELYYKGSRNTIPQRHWLERCAMLSLVLYFRTWKFCRFASPKITTGFLYLWRTLH